MFRRPGDESLPRQRLREGEMAPQTFAVGSLRAAYLAVMADLAPQVLRDLNALVGMGAVIGPSPWDMPEEGRAAIRAWQRKYGLLPSDERDDWPGEVAWWAVKVWAADPAVYEPEKPGEKPGWPIGPGSAGDDWINPRPKVPAAPEGMPRYHALTRSRRWYIYGAAERVREVLAAVGLSGVAGGAATEERARRRARAHAAEAERALLGAGWKRTPEINLKHIEWAARRQALGETATTIARGEELKGYSVAPPGVKREASRIIATLGLVPRNLRGRPRR